MSRSLVWAGIRPILAALALGAVVQGLTAAASPPPSAWPEAELQGSLWQRYGLSGTDLRAVDALRSDLAWAVGTDGMLARWDGATWAAYDNTKLGPLPFNDVDVVSDAAAWAVANRGAVARWDGTLWVAEPLNTGTANMLSISMASPTDGWVVGTTSSDSPVFARYNGTSWSPVPTSDILRPVLSVDAVDSNNAWAVGGRFGHPPMGEITRWNGTSWTLARGFDSTVLYSVDMLDATYGWAVGSGGALWQWDGAQWTQATPPSTGATLLSVSVVSRNEAWALGGLSGSVVIWRWNGTAWNSVPVPSGVPLGSLTMFSSGEGWAAGSRATIARWNGSAWAVSTTRSNTSGYWGLDFLDRNDGWAVGSVDTFLPSSGLQHWNGSTWELYQAPGSPLIIVDVDMVASDAVWAVGTDGEIFKWNGANWTMEDNAPYGLKAISMVSTTEGWAVGGNTAQAAIRHFTGGQWTDYPVSVANNLDAIDMVDANEGWAGGIGMLFHYLNGTWTQVSSSMSVNGIDMLNRDEGWAVGYEGSIWHYQNGTWTPQASPTTAILERVHMISPNEGWTVGEMPGTDGPGVLLHYLNGVWSLAPQPTGRALKDVYAFDANEGWAAGITPGVLLHFEAEPPLTPTRTPSPPPPTATGTQPPATRTATPGTPLIATSTPTAPVTATATATPCAITFGDVQPADYFYIAVRHLACAGVISGYSDGTFRPYNNATRGQMTKIVVLAFGYDIYTPGIPSFSDVPATNPFYAYVETAAFHQIVSGYSDGTFRPYNNLTRGQLSKIVVAAAGWPLSNPPMPTFSDVPADHPFYEYVETAYDHQIISGYSGGIFRPANNATRGQIAKIVYNAISQR